MSVGIRHRALSCGEVVDSCIDKWFSVTVFHIATERKTLVRLVLINAPNHSFYWRFVFPCYRTNPVSLMCIQSQRAEP